MGMDHPKVLRLPTDPDRPPDRSDHS
jgi:hypothetical protein